MRSFAVVPVLLGLAFATAGAQIIRDGNFQTPPPTPWEEIQPDSSHVSAYYPRDTLGGYCGLTDVSIRGTDTVMEARLRETELAMTWVPIYYTIDLRWDMWYVPGASGEIASFGLMFVAHGPDLNTWDTLFYQFGKVGLEQPRPHFGVVNLDTGQAGEWQHGERLWLSTDWRDAGLNDSYVMSHVVLISKGLDQEGTWCGQEVRWDDVDLGYFIDPVAEHPSRPTRPPSLHVWPTVSRGPIRYESTTPVLVYDASGRRVTVLPPGSGRASLPFGGVFFLRSGGSVAKLTML